VAASASSPHDIDKDNDDGDDIVEEDVVESDVEVLEESREGSTGAEETSGSMEVDAFDLSGSIPGESSAVLMADGGLSVERDEHDSEAAVAAEVDAITDQLLEAEVERMVSLAARALPHPKLT
jgi:hypothetical protein